MADLSITVANVAGGGRRNQYARGTAGATITQGMPVYKISSTGLIAPAANTSAAAADAVGIAVNAALSGQEVAYQTEGPITIGATVAPGQLYVVSAAGAISPVNDHTTGDYMTYLGAGTSTTVLDISIHASGVAATTDVT